MAQSMINAMGGGAGGFNIVTEGSACWLRLPTGRASNRQLMQLGQYSPPPTPNSVTVVDRSVPL